MKKSIIFIAFISIILAAVVIIFILFNKENANNEEYNSIEDLKGKKIGTLLGSPLTEEETRKIIPDVNVTFYNDAMDSIASLQGGHIDGAIVSYPTAFLVKQNIKGLKVLDNLTNDEAGIAVSKANEKLFNDVNKYIKTLKEDGTLDEMVSRWYNENEPNYNMPNISFPTIGNPILVGVAADREPSCFLNAKGEVIGLDSEIAYRIAAHLNRPIKFVEMKFASLVNALESGKVDLVVSNLIITDERKKSVFMTEGYFNSPLVLIVREEN